MEKKIAEIRKEFEAASFSEIPALIEAYWEDERSGVRNLIGKYEKKLLSTKRGSAWKRCVSTSMNMRASMS